MRYNQSLSSSRVLILTTFFSKKIFNVLSAITNQLIIIIQGEKMNNNSLAQEFNFWSLLKFTLPSTIGMIITATFLIVDGFFVANYIGETALASINIVFPMLSVTIAIAIMFATGGGAIISKYMGEKNMVAARSLFTSLNFVLLIIGFILTIIFTVFPENISYALGARDEFLLLSTEYLRIIGCFSIPFIASLLSQSLYATAGKPQLILIVSILGGLTNAVLDFLFIVSFNMGIKGAALATGISYLVIFIIYIYFFTTNRKGTLYFDKCTFNLKEIIKSITNGMSEFITSIASSITTMLFNLTLLQIVGGNGLASFTAIQYLQWLLSALLLGFAYGVAPIIGFKYGAGNRKQLKFVFRNSFGIIIGISVLTFIFSQFMREELINIFISKTSLTYPMAVQGLTIVSLSFLFIGGNMYASSVFTAYSNSKVSAFLSFLRTGLIIISIIFLPYLFKYLGVNQLYGVWFSIPIGEGIAFIVAMIMFAIYRKRYSF